MWGVGGGSERRAIKIGGGQRSWRRAHRNNNRGNTREKLQGGKEKALLLEKGTRTVRTQIGERHEERIGGGMSHMAREEIGRELGGRGGDGKRQRKIEIQ